MTKPTAAIISNDTKLSEGATKALRGVVRKDSGIEFKLKNYDSRERIGNLGDVQLTISDAFRTESPGYQLMRRLKDRNGSARILLTTMTELEKEYLEDPKGSLIGRYEAANLRRTESGKQAHRLEDWFRGNNPDYNDIVIQELDEFPEQEFSKAVRRVRDDGKMKQSQTMGLIGLGKLGRQMVHDLKSKPSLDSAHIFSAFAKDDYEGLIIPRMAFEGDQRKKFYFDQSIEEVIESNPDFLAICTGEYGVKYENYDKIKNLTERLMQGAYPKVVEILKVVKDMGYNNTICMEANPTGPLLQVAKRLGIDPAILTSITPDMSRHKTLLLEKISEKDPSISYSDIELMVIGEHGKEIPLLREATVRGKPLTEAYPEFNNHTYRRAFINEAREIGLRLMKVSEELGDNYGGTPDKIVEHIGDFSTLTRTIPSAYSYFEEADCFIGAPSIIDYPLRIRSVATKLDDLSQDKEVMKELSKHIAYQKALTNEYHPA